MSEAISSNHQSMNLINALTTALGDITAGGMWRFVEMTGRITTGDAMWGYRVNLVSTLSEWERRTTFTDGREILDKILGVAAFGFNCYLIY